MVKVFVSLVIYLAAVRQGDTVFYDETDDGLAVVREVIHNTNQDIIAKNLQEIKFRDFSYHSAFGSFSTTEGKIGLFSTIRLKGEKQFFNETDGFEETIFLYDLYLGLEEFKVTFKYNYDISYFISGSGQVEMSASDNLFQVKGYVTTDKTGNCESNLSSLIVTQVDNFQVFVGNKEHTILKYILELIVKTVFPYLLPDINRYVDYQVINELPKSDFPKIVCEPFLIPQKQQKNS